jgi:hypothetical protein
MAYEILRPRVDDLDNYLTGFVDDPDRALERFIGYIDDGVDQSVDHALYTMLEREMLEDQAERDESDFPFLDDLIDVNGRSRVELEAMIEAVLES